MTSSGLSATSWFATRAGRRYGIELGLLLLAKLALLTALYFLFIAPQPRADTSPGAVRSHLLDTKNSAAPAGESHDRS
jgi:hypothetical protein